jgi:ABC-type Fe3+/spermidine/putrescine transport system ATPase subunit
MIFCRLKGAKQMLELKNAVKVYRRAKGPAVTALNNVSFILPENGLVFILGKSGSGKSTLLNVLGGLDSLTEGDFLVDGTSTRHFKPSDFDHYRAETVGFVFQSYNLLPHLDVGGTSPSGFSFRAGVARLRILPSLKPLKKWDSKVTRKFRSMSFRGARSSGLRLPELWSKGPA